ncbi:MAG: hypothetical protein ACFCD0_12150 [Gemmataceae bacterium]
MQKWISLVVGIVVIGLTGCGADPKDKGGPVEYGSVTPSEVTLAPGKSTTITVEVDRKGYEGVVVVKFDRSKAPSVYVDEEETTRTIKPGKNSADYTLIAEPTASSTKEGSPEVLVVTVRGADIKDFKAVLPTKKVLVTIKGGVIQKKKDERKRYLTPKENTLSEVGGAIRGFGEKSPKFADFEEKLKFYADLKEVSDKQKSAEAKLQAVRDADVKNWEALKGDADTAIEEASTALKKLKEKYKLK